MLSQSYSKFCFYVPDISQSKQITNQEQSSHVNGREKPKQNERSF